MKTNALLSISLIALLALTVCSPVSAQAETQLISIHPMDTATREALEQWLNTSAPVPAPFYAVTYIEAAGYDFYVSLVGLNISSPDEEWHFTEEPGSPSKVLWVGSVKVLATGVIEPLYENGSASSAKVASPRLAGGGSHVSFPFAAGSFVIYGPRGVHGSGDYSTSGMVAVDLVSGDDLGGSAASSAVYASVAGTIDFVCDDDTSVAVRLSGGSETIIYAHLKDNENLTMSHSFEKGEYIGDLKYGSFDDDCGWAEQKDNHYHLHWMFTPASNAFRAENCILSTTTKKWTCGTQTIGIGGKLFGGGGGPDGIDTPGNQTNQERSFWDGLLIAFVSIVDRGALKLLPEHNSPTAILTGVINMVRMLFRLVWTLTKFNLNLGPIMALLILTIGAKVVFGVVWVAFAVLRTIKALPGA